MLPMDYVATFISSCSFHLAFHGVYMYGISLDVFFVAWLSPCLSFSNGVWASRSQ